MQKQNTRQGLAGLVYRVCCAEQMVWSADGCGQSLFDLFDRLATNVCEQNSVFVGFALGLVTRQDFAVAQAGVAGHDDPLALQFELLRLAQCHYVLLIFVGKLMV